MCIPGESIICYTFCQLITAVILSMICLQQFHYIRSKFDRGEKQESQTLEEVA